MRLRKAARPYSVMMASVMANPSLAIRSYSHLGTEPLWRGRSAEPLRRMLTKLAKRAGFLSSGNVINRAALVIFSERLNVVLSEFHTLFPELFAGSSVISLLMGSAFGMTVKVSTRNLRCLVAESYIFYYRCALVHGAQGTSEILV